LPRHPSQLYEAFAEGLLLFLFLWWYSSKPRPRMAVTGVFMLGYGFSRFIIEFFRQPDIDQGFILLGWMTKGQILSAPMIIIGLFLIGYAYKRGIYDWGKQAAY
jgi:phosphatidylglycerol:prolipoprotein diacylglycerol transferase